MLPHLPIVVSLECEVSPWGCIRSAFIRSLDWNTFIEFYHLGWQIKDPNSTVRPWDIMAILTFEPADPWKVDGEPCHYRFVVQSMYFSANGATMKKNNVAKALFYTCNDQCILNTVPVYTTLYFDNDIKDQNISMTTNLLDSKVEYGDVRYSVEHTKLYGRYPIEWHNRNRRIIAKRTRVCSSIYSRTRWLMNANHNQNFEININSMQWWQ